MFDVWCVIWLKNSISEAYLKHSLLEVEKDKEE